MITIGNIAKQYGLLPSQVAEHATSYDIMIADVYATWENHRRDPSANENYDTAQLEELMSTVRK
jgi:hypothetical protein